MDKPYEIRSVQLDLGRQVETLDYIRDFIDFAAQFGYNSLHLYLEARIRTASFPYPAEIDSYSIDDMKLIVDHAAKRGMDVVPQVNCFSHVEHFLRYPELLPLSELREPDATGRFGGKSPGLTFCPSQEATYDFLEAYLTEVAAAFPSTWFHVGLDEVWEIGRCSECRRRISQGETQGDLFLQHLLRLHQIVVGKLGKRMMMWDDMLEEYPAILDQMPTDIVQCVWQYNNLVDRCKTHFGNQARDWRLADYQERGISFLVCPVNWNPLNTESLSRHAAPYQPLGGLMTIWENSTRFMLVQYPIIAFAGRLWEDGRWWRAKEIFRECCAELLGSRDGEFLDAVWAFSCGNFAARLSPPASQLHGDVTPSEEQAAATLRLIRNVIATTNAGDVRAREVLDDMLVNVDLQLAGHALRSVAEEAWLHWAGQPTPPRAILLEEARDLLGQVQSLKVRRAEQWEHLRTGLPHQSSRPILAAEESAIADFVDRLTRDEEAVGLLRIRYALPDCYGSQKVRVLVRHDDDMSWHTVYEGVPKPRMTLLDDMPFYLLEHPLPGKPLLERVRIETWGYGGIGLLYMEYLADALVLVPDRVVDTEGRVERPEAILTDNTVWCQMGEVDVHASFHHPELADAVHHLELILKSRT